MQYEHSIALAPAILNSSGFDERLLFRVHDWASSLPNCELAHRVCLSVRQALESDAAGMYLTSYSILSSVERFLACYGLLDSFIYAMRESPVRLPGDPNLRKEEDPPRPPPPPPRQPQSPPSGAWDTFADCGSHLCDMGVQPQCGNAFDSPCGPALIAVCCAASPIRPCSC